MAKGKRRARHRSRIPPRGLIRRVEEIQRLLDEGEQANAVRLAKRLVKQYPQYPEAWIALLLSTEGHLAYQAWATMHLCDLVPREAHFWFGLTAAAAGMGQIVLAYEAAQRYLTLEPDGEFAAEASSLLEGVEESVENLIQNLQKEYPHLTPQEAKKVWVLHEKAEIAFEVGEIETSAQYNQQVLDLAPNFIPAKNNLAISMFRMGQHDEALRLLREVYEEHPEDGFTLAFLARYTRMLGRHEEAESYIEQLRRLKPETGDAAFAKLETLAIFGTEQEILDAFEEVQRLQPLLFPKFLSRAYHYAAATHMRLGNEQQAQTLWEEALDIDEENYLAEESLDDFDVPPYARHVPWYFEAELLLPDIDSREVFVDAILALSEMRTNEEAVSIFHSVLEQYPYLPHILPALLERGDLHARLLAMMVALHIKTPEAMQALYNAATGRWGADTFRLILLHVLWPDWIPRDRPLTVYMLGEQVTVDLPDVEITSSEKVLPENPDAILLLEEAREALQEAPWRSELLFKKTLELEPNAVGVIRDWAVSLLFQRRTDEAKQLLEDGLKRMSHPPLLRTLQARIALMEEDVQAAENYLRPLEQERMWDPVSWGHYCEARIWLALYQEDASQVRRWLIWWYLLDPAAEGAAEPYWNALWHGTLRETWRRLARLPRVRKRKPPAYLEDIGLHIGDHVRVRKGVRDPDFPGQRLDGYSGWVIDVNELEGGYGVLIAWDARTLSSIPEKIWQKGEEENLDLTKMWLLSTEVEPA